MVASTAMVGSIGAMGSSGAVTPGSRDKGEKVKVLSASWGTDNGVSCPRGVSNLDNLPVTFNSFIKRSSIQVTDFVITRSDGTTVRPTCALQFPPDERDERQTVNLIGNFGTPVTGPIPATVQMVGALRAKAIGGLRWHRVGKLPSIKADPLAGGPFITDAWQLTERLYKNDQNRCTTGSTFIRVMWSNGLTAYATGEEVGAAVTDSYRAVFKLANGKRTSFAPLAVADLYDHSTAANADNMHDLCLDDIPRGAKLRGITIGADLIQDPNGDPNRAQHYGVPRR